MDRRGIDVLDDLMDVPEHAADMNEALAAWAAEHGVEATADIVPAGTTGPCATCGTHATARCLRCERLACARHHHVMVGLCTRCVGQDDGEGEPVDEPARFADERPARGAALDVDWIE